MLVHGDMAFAKRKLVTIVVPEGAEPAVAKALGSITTGFSVVAARGRGEHGARPDVWRSGNVQIEVIVSATDMERVEAILDRFYPETALVAWVVDVDAWPPVKFGGSP
jgi:hypothetical protein